MVTKLDGSKEPFEPTELRTFLEKHLSGLNKEFMNLEIIVDKVQKGIYNGKPFLNLCCKGSSRFLNCHPFQMKSNFAVKKLTAIYFIL